jgi:hypothetical protein
MSELPTAEDCVNKLASMFTTTTTTNKSQGDLPQKVVRFALPATTKDHSHLHVIGQKPDVFEIKICVEKYYDLCQLGGSTSKDMWLSYRFMGGTVVQSDSLSYEKDFMPMINAFRLQGSMLDLTKHFSEKKHQTLKIYLCTEGEVIGTASIDLRQLILFDQESDGRIVYNEYSIKPHRDERIEKIGDENRNNQAFAPRIAVRLCIDRVPANNSEEGHKVMSRGQHSHAIVSSSTSSQTMNDDGEQLSSPKDSLDLLAAVAVASNKENELSTREKELLIREKELLEATASLERKRSEWEQWRYQQEGEWQEKLRRKKAAMLQVVEERTRVIEKERLGELQLSKKEYEKLENRLRKAVLDVEAKERQLKDIELRQQHQVKIRLAELESKEKLLKEELKHSIEIERAKTSAAIEDGVAARKAVAAANKKVDMIMCENDKLREQQRSSPEFTLLHQLAELKGQLVDSERRIETLKSEKNQISIEKEHFRSNVHKMAKALQHERKKTMTKKREECNNQQVRLSYDTDENAFVLGGGQAEIQRILSDLCNISQLKVGSIGSGVEQHDNKTHPTPSPQPIRPLNGNTFNVDLNGMMATPG